MARPCSTRVGWTIAAAVWLGWGVTPFPGAAYGQHRGAMHVERRGPVTAAQAIRPAPIYHAGPGMFHPVVAHPPALSAGVARGIVAPGSPVRPPSSPRRDMLLHAGGSGSFPQQSGLGAAPGLQPVLVQQNTLQGGAASGYGPDAQMLPPGSSFPQQGGMGPAPGSQPGLVQQSMMQGTASPGAGPYWGLGSAPGGTPAAQAASSGGRLLLVNAKDSSRAVDYSLSGTPYTMQPSYTQTLTGRASWLVAFDRGGGLGQARYTLTDGTYTFTQTAKGWELYNTTFKSTLDNTANASDFVFQRDGRAEAVKAKGSLELTSKYPIVVRFDRGNGGPSVEHALDDGVYRVGMTEGKATELVPASEARMTAER